MLDTIKRVSRADLVRVFEPLDLEAVQNLFDDCQYPVGVSNSQRHEWLERPSYVHRLVAIDDSRILGHVGLASPDGNRSFEQWRMACNDGQDLLVVTRLLVNPASRMLGLATHLMKHAHHISAQNNATPVLDVIASNHAARALYNALGYRYIGNAPYTSMNGTSMEKALYVLGSNSP